MYTPAELSMIAFHRLRAWTPFTPTDSCKEYIIAPPCVAGSFNYLATLRPHKLPTLPSHLFPQRQTAKRKCYMTGMVGFKGTVCLLKPVFSQRVQEEKEDIKKKLRN